MNSKEKQELQILACKSRLYALEGIFNAKSGHPGGSLSAADIYVYLYSKVLNVNPADPDMPNRDRFVLTIGHCCPTLYAVLAMKGFFPIDELPKLRKVGAMLQGHPDMKSTPGIDMSSGSLGQGISAACGMALAGKIDKKSYKVYTLLGDGECEEGQVWEALMFAANKNLNNLCVIIDSNGLQIDGPVEEVGGLEPLDKKLEAFGFDVFKMDGHDFDSIENAINAAAASDKPTAIIAATVKGKGVSFMENKVNWHGAAPNAEQYEIARNELLTQLSQLGGEL